MPAQLFHISLMNVLVRQRLEYPIQKGILFAGTTT